jgi:endoglucanase
VDYWTILNRINLEMQAKDSAATIIGRDRVHPGTAGNFIMAYEFLKTTGAPKEVADINISKNKTDSKVGDKITGVAYTKNGLSFTALEKALPFPLADFKQAATMVPFIEAMDEETLKVADILPGKYKLTIDTFSAGTYTADQLAAGINLATITATPQMAQSMKVYATLQEIWKNEANNRLVKQIETSQAYIDYPDKQNMLALTHNLDSINTNRPNPNSTLKKEIALYADAKAGEAAAYKKIDELRILVYQINKPVPHVFKLEKL